MLAAIVTFILVMLPICIVYGICALIAFPFMVIKKIMKKRDEKGPRTMPVYPFF